jgi:hypothetical protein
MCACICEGESVSVSKLERLLHGDVDFRSTNEVEVLIISGSIEDACVVEYNSVLVLVLVSKFEMLLHSCNSNWRRFSEGHPSVLDSTRELIPIDPGSPYVASLVEDGLSSSKV